MSRLAASRKPPYKCVGRQCQRILVLYGRCKKLGKQQDRVTLVKEITRAACLYKEKLVGKKFLYVFEGKSIEVIFKAANFMHLTGVNTPLTALHFYKYAVNGRLQANQIFFNDRHPYSLSIRKIRHLCEIASLAGSENFVLEEIGTSTFIYKFGVTDLHFSLCMFEEVGASGEKIYVAGSLRDEDCFAKAQNVYAMNYIFVKPNNQKTKYKECLFADHSCDFNTLPEAAKGQIDEEVYAQMAAIYEAEPYVVGQMEEAAIYAS